MDFSERLKHRERYSHVRENENGMHLLEYMTEKFPRFTREQWAEQIANNKVYINNLAADCDTILKKHDRVSLFEAPGIEPAADLSFEICYKDEHLIIFNKSANLCVHPTGPFYRHTLWYQAGMRHGELFFIGRLDRETSGLIIGARTKKITAAMQAQDFHIHKEYHALVHGKFDKYLRCTGFLSKDTKSIIPKKRRFTFDFAENSESADTEFFPVRTDGRFSLVKAILHSGRMHQIRATLFSLGYPLVGDKLYGPDETLYNKISSQSFSPADLEKLLLPNQALHCSKLEFLHPASKELISIACPAEFASFLPETAKK